MKQTVEEAACTHWSESTYNKDAELAYDERDCIAIKALAKAIVLRAFKKGADWQARQSPWISVEERLPEKPKYDWVLVIIRDKRDGFIGIPQIGELRSDGFWHTETSDTFNTPNFRRIYNTTDVLGEFLKQEVVAWCPIPSFEEILEANKDVLERIKEKGD